MRKKIILEYQKYGYSQTEAKKAYEDMLSVIGGLLKRGEKVVFNNLFTMYPIKYTHKGIKDPKDKSRVYDVEYIKYLMQPALRLQTALKKLHVPQVGEWYIEKESKTRWQVESLIRKEQSYTVVLKNELNSYAHIHLHKLLNNYILEEEE